MKAEWTICTCSRCGAQTEWSDRWDDGPFPMRAEDCPCEPKCGSWSNAAPKSGVRARLGLKGFVTCPGVREITVVEKNNLAAAVREFAVLVDEEGWPFNFAWRDAWREVLRTVAAPAPSPCPVCDGVGLYWEEDMDPPEQLPCYGCETGRPHRRPGA